MHRRKKQLLGLAGLALVAAMTAIACIIPAPDASAAFVTEPTTVKVQVINNGELPVVEIKSLDNNDIVINRSFKVTIGYTKATELRVFIKNTGAALPGGRAGVDPDADEVPADLSQCDIQYSEAERTCEATYTLPGDLTDVNGVGFTTRAVAVNADAGSATSEDSVAFLYRSAYLLKFGGQYVTNGDPIMEAKMNDDVKSAYIVIQDKDGNIIKTPFDDDNALGMYKLDLSQKKGDTLKFALPLWESQAASGDYKVILMAYDTETPNFAGDANTSLVAVSTVSDVKYTVKNTDKPGENVPDPNLPGQPNNPNNPDRPVGPDNPDKPDNPDQPDQPDDPNKPLPPDTGSLFRDLNISRADYILTGVIAFGLITGFAIFLMIRRSKR